MRVDATSYDRAAADVCDWARMGLGGYVCVATVHMVMEALDDPGFRRIVNHASLVTADGVPLVWGLRRLGVSGAGRVYGPDLTRRICKAAADRRIAVGFYGGTPEVLRRLQARLRGAIPELEIACALAPPFRSLTASEQAKVAEDVNASGARILFVGIGCPNQERFMARHAADIGAVMLGVGAAFDFLAGVKRQAPAWLQSAGLEWAFRLASEPRRLWRRYLRHNPRFVGLFARQLLAEGPRSGQSRTSPRRRSSL